MFTTARAPADEIRRTLPMLRRLLLAFFALSAASVVAQLALLQVSDGSSSVSRVERDPESEEPPCADLLDNDSSSLGEALDAEANRTSLVVPGSDSAVPRRGDLHIPGLVMALFGLPMSAHELHMRKRLLTFACFTFLNFAASTVLLLQKLETPPGARHLLSIHCPVPAADIAQFVRQQQRRFRKRLASGLPGRGDLLPSTEEAWPVTLPRDAFVDLCSPAWALGNAYLLASGALVLLMHAYAVRMLRSVSSIADDGAYPEGLMGSAGRVVLLHPGGSDMLLHPNGGFASAGAAEQPQRTFVPFSGPPQKLDF